MNNAPLVSKPPNLVLYGTKRTDIDVNGVGPFDRVEDRAANNVEDDDLNIAIAELSPHRVNYSILLVDNRGISETLAYRDSVPRMIFQSCFLKKLAISPAE